MRRGLRFHYLLPLLFWKIDTKNIGNAIQDIEMVNITGTLIRFLSRDCGGTIDSNIPWTRFGMSNTESLHSPTTYIHITGTTQPRRCARMGREIKVITIPALAGTEVYDKRIKSFRDIQGKMMVLMVAYLRIFGHGIVCAARHAALLSKLEAALHLQRSIPIHGVT